VRSRTNSADYDLTTEVALRIGFGEVDDFSGKIREVRLFGRALPRNEIAGSAADKPWIVSECCNPAAGSTYEMAMPVAAGPAELAGAEGRLDTLGCDFGCEALPGPTPTVAAPAGRRLLAAKTKLDAVLLGQGPGGVVRMTRNVDAEDRSQTNDGRSPV